MKKVALSESSINVRVPIAIKNAMLIEAKRQGRSISSLTRDLFLSVLKKQDREVIMSQ